MPGGISTGEDTGKMAGKQRSTTRQEKRKESMQSSEANKCDVSYGKGVLLIGVEELSTGKKRELIRVSKGVP